MSASLGVHPVVVVTGASGGIGRATVREFAKLGARVALIARGADGLQSAADEVRDAGGTALILPLDVADADAVEAAAARVESQLGPIDVWVNCAFSSVFSTFAELTADEYRRITEVTYLGFVYGTMAALKRMRARGRGTIVQVGSALGYRGIPLQTAYSGAKHGIQGFTEALRCELLHEHSPVHITLVNMPGVNTPQFTWVRTRLPNKAQPVPPIYQPEVAARAVVYAARHPRRREYWVGGSTVLTIMANAVAPALLDRYLAKTGFSSQQTDQPTDPDQPTNLTKPADADADYGAHGAFDDQASSRSVQQWLAQRPALVGGALAAGALGGLAALGRAASRAR